MVLDQATCIYFMIRFYHHFFVHFAIKPVVLPPNWMFPSCGTYNVHQLMFINIWVPKITRPESGPNTLWPSVVLRLCRAVRADGEVSPGRLRLQPQTHQPIAHGRWEFGQVAEWLNCVIFGAILTGILRKNNGWICKKWSWSQISEATASQNLGSDWQQSTFSDQLWFPRGRKSLGQSSARYIRIPARLSSRIRYFSKG